jgi:hypothetical protein
MLKTRQERVELLKAGIFGKTIERLYIRYNNFKIVGNPNFYEMVGINTGETRDMVASQEATAESSL